MGVVFYPSEPMFRPSMNALLRIAAALAPLALVACASVPPAPPATSVSAEAVVEDLADEAVEDAVMFGGFGEFHDHIRTRAETR